MNKQIDIRFFALAFFVLAILLRFFPHTYNVAAVGALGMFVGCFWSARMGFLMSLAAMGISDILGHFLNVPSMGFYNPAMMLAVYVAVGCSAGIGKLVGSGRTMWRIPLVAGVPLGAIAATVVFYLVTNFAAWLDPLLSYPRTLDGLVQCYVAALPFAKNTLLGNCIFSVLFFGAHALLQAPAQKMSSSSATDNSAR